MKTTLGAGGLSSARMIWISKSELLASHSRFEVGSTYPKAESRACTFLSLHKEKWKLLFQTRHRSTVRVSIRRWDGVKLNSKHQEWLQKMLLLFEKIQKKMSLSAFLRHLSRSNINQQIDQPVSMWQIYHVILHTHVILWSSLLRCFAHFQVLFIRILDRFKADKQGNYIQ